MSLFDEETSNATLIVSSSGTVENNELSISDYATLLTKSLDEAYRIAMEKLLESHRRQKNIMSSIFMGNSFKVGDLVWLHSPVVLWK